MAYCRKCGKLLAEGVYHCTVCGATVTSQLDKMDTGRIPTISRMDPSRTAPGQPQDYGGSIRLGGQQPLRPLQGQSTAQMQPPAQPPRKKKNGTLIVLYILLALLVLALLGVGAWLLLGDSLKKEEDPKLGRYDVVSCVQDEEQIPTNGEYVILRDKGEAVLCLDEEQDATWTLEDTDLTLETEDSIYDGSLEGSVLTLRAEGVDYTFEKANRDSEEEEALEQTDPTGTTAPRTQDRSWWAGDWYGWWTVLEGTGDFYLMEQAGWDVCARIEPGQEDTCSLLIWDEHPEESQFRWELEGTFGDGSDDRGILTVREGSFRGGALGGELTSDPAAEPYAAYPELLCITGTYVDPENPENTCTYSIFLRPWGADWEDLRAGDTDAMPYPNMMPLRYDSWYLPLIRGGAAMPDAFN